MECWWDRVSGIIMQGNFEKFCRLVKRKKNIVQSKNKDGNTLLHLVAHYVEGSLDDFEYDYIPFIKYLLEKGADINAQNKEKKTPLDLSTRFGCSQETIFLLAHGAKSGHMSIKQLSNLIVGVSNFKFPEDYNYDLYKEVKLICGVLDAYNKCKEAHSKELSSSINEVTQNDIQEYINELHDICSREASSDLLETIKEYFNPNIILMGMTAQDNNVFGITEDYVFCDD